jgi:hypothetical protein
MKLAINDVMNGDFHQCLERHQLSHNFQGGPLRAKTAFILKLRTLLHFSAHGLIMGDI